MKKFLLAFLLFASPCFATTWTAASCNTSAVQTAINSASNGDKVLIPNGSCTWTSGITTTKQIQIEGATAGGVIITDNDTNVNDSLLDVTTGGSFHVIIGNLSFLPGTATGNYITVGGTGLVCLMHDMSFNVPHFQIQRALVWEAQGGVIWNTNVVSTDNIAGACGSQVGSDSGSILIKSPLSWDTPSTMGMLDTNGDKNVYLENDNFTYVGQIPDVDDNGRVVIRYSNVTNVSGGLTHGTSSTTGGRQVELYNDTFAYTNTNRNANRYFWMRAGTLLVTNNAIQAMSGPCYGSKDSFTFIVESVRWNAAGHGCCTGYMCFHQDGAGAVTPPHAPPNLDPSQSPPDTAQASDPVYMWNNTGTGQGSSHVGFNDVDPAQDNCHNINPATGLEWTTGDVFKNGRDLFVDNSSNPANGPKPGWVPYTYPHPLRALVNGGPPVAPSPASVTVVVNLENLLHERVQ